MTLDRRRIAKHRRRRLAVRARIGRLLWPLVARFRDPCLVCGQRHAGFIERDGRETPYCANVPGNTQSRYPEIRREVGARGVALGHINDVCLDDLTLAYKTPGAVIEALCADPRPDPVTRIVGPRFTTKTMERI